MSDQHTKGTISKARGKLEQGLGKLTGNKQQQVQGIARQVQGDAQGLLGDVQDAVSNFEWPTIDLSSLEVGKAVNEAAAAVHIGRRAQRPRWPVAVGGLVLAGLTGWVILHDEALRARLARRVAAIRDRILAARSNWSGRPQVARENPIAFPAAATASIESSPFRDSTAIDAGYPAGLGSTNGDGIPVLEATGNRV